MPGGVEPPPSPRRLGADYDTDWARRVPARLARLALLEGVMRPAVAALGAPERDGIDRLAGLTDGPVIFAGNHHSHLDTPVVLTSIPEPWRHKVFVGAAADYFFRTRLTSVASALVIGAIPIERSKVTRRSAEPVVVLSLTEYEALEETLHLLSNPVNAERLAKSIAQAEAGQLVEHELEGE